MAITRILVTGDFLRPLETDPLRSESVRRIRWLEDLLSPPLSLVTDLPVQRLVAEGDLDIRALYADCGLEPSLGAWTELYAGDLSDRLAARLIDLCRDAIVVSIELPPSVATVLRNAGVPVIDAVVDPHRFLYDIPMAWRSTVPEVRDAIEPFRVSRFEIARRAAQIKAKSRWIHPIDVPANATLVLDQVASDSAMIDPARRRGVSWCDYADALEDLRTRGPIIWRPHPNNVVTGVVTHAMSGAIETDANIYLLLCHDNLARVAAISSGGVVEARAFGKEGLHFLDRFGGIPIEGWGTPVPVIGDWLSPHFWSTVLAPVIETRPDAPTLPKEKDFLRRATNWDWGFGWID